MASENKAAPFAGRSFTPGEVYDVQKHELCSIGGDVTLDPETANNQLTLSEGNKTAAHGAWQRYDPRPERFDKHPQVFAKDALQGIHYWEVEWSDSPNESVYVGVAYGGIDRKSENSDSMFGNNNLSWIFGQYSNPSMSKPVISAWHNGKVWQGTFPSGGCKGVGMLLDWHSGTLSFSKVSENKRIALNSFKTKFTEPVYPCFWVGQSGNYLALRPVQSLNQYIIVNIIVF